METKNYGSGACMYAIHICQAFPPGDLNDNESLVLNVMFTHPDYRNHGAAGLLVQWGTEQAGRLGIEAYVKGTCLGRSVYERYGFVMMHIAELEFRNESPGEE